MLADAQRFTGRDEAFALDVAQDVFMKIIRSMKPLACDAALRAWMRRTVRSVAIDHLRRDVRRQLRERAHGASAPSTPDDAPPALADQLAWLERMTAELDPHASTLLLMRHRFGWTLERIGATLGLGPGAVDGRLRRVVAQLKQDACRQETSDV